MNKLKLLKQLEIMKIILTSLSQVVRLAPVLQKYIKVQENIKTLELKVNEEEGTVQFLERLQRYPDWNREEQIRQNISAMKKLEERMKRNQAMSEDEARAREEFLLGFQELMDAERPTGQKLYS
ncbi:MAG: hypothetical protein AB4372_40330 [Xenococcus sp. (in: cyanobacteria)]